MVDPGDTKRLRLLAVYTHPVQYYAPLFRTLTERHPEIELEVLYITRPTPVQQGQGFGVAFEWDQDLLKGYRWRVFREPLPGDDYMRWRGLDAPAIGRAIAEARPDAVLLPGWNCVGLVRALFACNRLKIPVLYRGDTNLWQKPQGIKRLIWSRKNRFLLNRFSGFLAVGKRARIFLREHGIPEERIVDSPHAVDSPRIRQDAGDSTTPTGRARIRAELGVGTKDFLVLLAGKLEPRKDPESAVRAVSELGESAVLAVCGSGELEASCRAVAAATGARMLWLGFRNQSELPRLYGAADALVLPSVSETWGLAVNEAMAVGTPCIVSDAVGCAPDLIEPGLTGEIFPTGSHAILVDGLRRLQRLGSAALSAAVRAKADAHSLERAADGLMFAATMVASGDWPSSRPQGACRVLALCEGMAILGGMERRTIEILDNRALEGAIVHYIVNSDPSFRFRISHRIEQGGHSWSVVRARATLFSGERSLAWMLRVLADVVSSSAGVLRACFARRPTVIFLSSFASALRSWPALLFLRGLGYKIVLRSGSAPAAGLRQQRIWKWLVDVVVSAHVAISDFIASEIRSTGIAPRKIRVIRNALPDDVSLPIPPGPLGPPIPSVIFVGQVIPEKGVLELLEALWLLWKRRVEFTATLVGRFHGWEHPSHVGYKAALASRIAEFPQGVVTVLGEREDVPALMQAASIHCCPSQAQQREGLGQVVLQAKAAGIPSVVTPSGALPEMIRHQVDGWVCRDFDSEAIAEGLAHFLLDPEARRAAAREAAEWRNPAFLRETVEREWRDLICSAFEGRAP